MFQVAPSSVVDFHFRPLRDSDVRSLSCHDIELVRAAHGTKCRFAVENALGAGQALTPQKSARKTVKFRWDSKLVEVPRGEGQWLFVSLANSYIRIGDERFGSESREIPVGFYPMASADLWKPPATQGGPNGGNKLQVKRTAALAVARFVFAVEGVVRPTVTQKDPAVVAEFAFRRC